MTHNINGVIYVITALACVMALIVVAIRAKR